LYQATKLSDLKYKEASNMYIMRRVKFNKVDSFDEVDLSNICGEEN
jgi:uncharacterized protein YkuJ